MNKEEIIIDGVDVRFCQYFNDKNEKCRTCSYVEGIKYTSYKCEDDKNCYYKQYRRLREENEKLKLQIAKQRNAKIQLKNLDSKFAEDYCNIKDKLKELMKQNKEMRNCYKSNLELCKFQEQQINKLATVIEKISKVLEVYFDDDNRATREIERIIHEVTND